MTTSLIPQRRGTDRIHTSGAFLTTLVSYTLLPAGDLSARERAKQTLSGRMTRGAMIVLTVASEAADRDGLVYASQKDLAVGTVLKRATFHRYFLELTQSRLPLILRLCESKIETTKPRYEVLATMVDSGPNDLTLRLRRPLPTTIIEWSTVSESIPVLR